MVYTVTLNPAVDYVVQLPEPLRTGQINRNEGESIQFGGKGINVSRVLNALGVENVALGFVAGFTGDALERWLRDAGLNTRFVHVKEGVTRINVKVRAGEETEINGIGPRITPEDMEKLHAKLDGVGAGDILVLSGSIPGGLTPDTYEKLLTRLAGRGIRVVVDAAGEALRSVICHRPFLVKPNHIELGLLFGQELRGDDEILACGKKLQEMGAGNVLVSMAGDGAMLLDETGGYHRIPSPRGTVINSVGAGDSMIAGFLAGYLNTGSYEYALHLGIAAGSATAFSLGLADRAAIEAVLSTMGR